jgi:hypothetical protein
VRSGVRYCKPGQNRNAVLVVWSPINLNLAASHSRDLINRPKTSRSMRMNTANNLCDPIAVLTRDPENPHAALSRNVYGPKPSPVLSAPPTSAAPHSEHAHAAKADALRARREAIGKDLREYGPNRTVRLGREDLGDEQRAQYFSSTPILLTGFRYFDKSTWG